MPAVTQLIPNLLGGVSTQSDEKKLPGQVTDAINAYPDPTFGMLKRNGMKFIRTVNKQDDTPFNELELKDAAWFFIQRGPTEAYFGAIKGTEIYVWNSITGNYCTVTNNGKAYLTGTKPEDYHFRSIQDVTVITNKTVSPELQAAPTNFKPNTVGTVVLKVVEYSATYRVTINGTNCDYKTRNSDEFDAGGTNTRLNADEVLTGIRNAINNKNLGVTVNQYETSLEITKSSAFTLSGKGGVNNQAIVTFQDSVTDVSLLPAVTTNGRYVEVLNAAGDEDNYWLQYNAAEKEWKEAKSPKASEGFKDSTMPHELVSTAADTFTFGPIPWKKRLAGDDITNPPPSIFPYDPDTDSYISPGKPINATFFYNSRFGLLSQDNVIMGQANDPYNLFARSALTQVNSDPVDINASSVRPVELFDVLPDSQGLLLFSKRQQFLMFAADTGVLTPNTAIIRAVSNYEMDSDIPPVDIGTTVGFVSKVPAYTRAFSMQTRGLEESPVVLDLSKVVSEYIPSTITALVSSPQNSFIALGSRNSKEVFIYRYYNNGEKDLFQAWVKWTTPGNVVAFTVVNDMMIIISSQMDQYTVSVISINDIPLGTVFSDDAPVAVANPSLDMASKPSAVTYNAATNLTTMTVGYTPLDYMEAILLIVPSSTIPTFKSINDLAFFNRNLTGQSDDIGYWTQVQNGTGNTFTLRGDWTDYADTMVIGYNYLFDITLPTFYYNRVSEGSVYDFSAYLNINRIKFSCGKSGAITFKLKAQGSSEWVDIQAVSDANYYEANTLPIKSEQQITVPINQRNMNFSLKVTSELPFPVSLNSIMWEGMYTPRYYRRS